MRIGHGYDVHCLQDALPLVLCGVRIPHAKGLVAYSDGDVALHALCDALLGAAALGDMGHFFPSTAKEFANMDSRIFLRKTSTLLADRNYQIINADITIIAQAPKIAPYIDAMRRNIAADIKTDISAINIKATTTDNIGFVGREEGIATHAVALIETLKTQQE